MKKIITKAMAVLATALIVFCLSKTTQYAGDEPSFIADIGGIATFAVTTSASIEPTIAPTVEPTYEPTPEPPIPTPSPTQTPKPSTTPTPSIAPKSTPAPTPTPTQAPKSTTAPPTTGAAATQAPSVVPAATTAAATATQNITSIIQTSSPLAVKEEVLNSITDFQSANKIIINEVVSLVNVPNAQKTTKEAVDELTLFVEEALAKASNITVSSGDIVINPALLSPVESAYNQALSDVESALSESGIELSRDIRKKVTLNLENGDSINAVFDMPSDNAEPINIKIVAPDFSLEVVPQPNNSKEPLVISAKVSESMVINQTKTPKFVNGAIVKTVNLSINRERLDEPMILSVQALPSDVSYQTVMIQDTPVPTHYNPFRHELEARVSVSGQYIVHENEIDFKDIENKALEMQFAIKYLASKGLMVGTRDGSFEPDADISRAEIASVILRCLGKLDANADGGYPDVTLSEWFFGSAGSAKSHDIMYGYDDGTFRGRQAASNEQIAAVMARVLKQELGYKQPQKPETYLLFSDSSDISEWAILDVSLSSRENLILSNQENTFESKKSLTRGEAAMLFLRLFDKIW